MKVAVIGDRHMVAGFSLLGIKKGFVSADPVETVRIMNTLEEDPDVCIILILDRIAEEIREFIDLRQREKKIIPLIIEIPGKDGPVQRIDPIELIVRRAVGINLRQEGIERDR